MLKVDTLRINAAMAKNCLSKKELSARSGISAPNISSILRRGTCEPRTAGKLAVGLGVNVMEIIAEGGDNRA